MNALLAIGTIVALTIVLVVVWYKSSTKLKILGLAVASDGSGALSILTAVPNFDYSTLYARKLIVYTKSLGRIYSTVCSITTPPGGLGVYVNSAAGAYKGTAAYAFDASDYVLISSI